MLLQIDPHKPGHKPRPLAMLRVRLCHGELTESMKAVTYDSGKTWEVIERHPVFRGCELLACDVVIEERIKT